MIFGFLKDKAKDKTIDYHNDWLKVSIFDRFFRFIGFLLIVGLGVIIISNGISIAPGGVDISGWLLPLIIILFILDVLFFRLISPWIWKGFVWLITSIWWLICEIANFFLSFLGDVLSWLVGAFGSILEFIFTFGGSKK